VARTPALTSVLVDGPALRRQRLRTGLTCTSVAVAAGLDPSFLARVERGERRIDIDDLVAVVRVLAGQWCQNGPTVVASGCTNSTAA